MNVTDLELGYPLRSSRLLLRPLAMDDVPGLLSYRSLPEVCRYVPFNPMDTETLHQRLRDSWNRRRLEAEGQAIVLGIELTSTGSLIGDVLLSWTSERHRSGEIGYVLNPAYFGQGFATEAAHRLLHYAFDDLQLHRIVARVILGNHSSVKVAMKLGMRQEAHLVENEWFKGRWIDELDFALLESEWRNSHKATTDVLPGCPPH